MALVLRLNRGASFTTINLNDGTNYKVLDTWNPRIAPRKATQFGGVPYNDVVENIPLYIRGTTAALVLEKVEDLIATLEQAYAWRLGAQIDPVLLEYLPQGTSLGAVVQCPVLGTPAEAQDMLTLAQLAMYMSGNSFETLLELPLIRRGLWLGTAETPADSSTVANPGAMSVTFANSLRIPSPVKLVFNDETGYGGGSPPEHKGWIFWADQADKIQILDSNVMSPYQGIGTWDTDTEASALGNSVRRMDLSGGAAGGIGGTISGFNAATRHFAMYASLANLSDTYAWTVTGLLHAGRPIQGRPKVLPPGDYPLLFFLGFFVTLDEVTSANILVESTNPSLDADSISIDYILLLAVDEFTGAVTFDDFAEVGLPDLDALTLDPQVLTFPYGRLTHSARSFTATAGTLYPQSVGTNLTTVVAGTTPAAGGGGLWELRHPTTGQISFSLTATRYPAYLIVR